MPNDIHDFRSSSHQENEKSEHEMKPRKTWNSTLEFMVSLIGCSAGMSDFWRFPYLIWRNGGGAFLLAYVTMLTICGIPLYFLEVVIGQYSGKGVFDVWNFYPLLKGIGISIAMLNLFFVSYASTFRYWLFEYMRQSFTLELPWTSCGHQWNTNSCRVAYESNVLGFDNSTDALSAEEEFWQYNILSLSGGIEEIGSFRWALVVWAIVLKLIVILCLLKSVKSVGKSVVHDNIPEASATQCFPPNYRLFHRLIFFSMQIMLITTFFPPLIGLAMLIQACTQTGAKDGIIFLFTPDFTRLSDSKVWIEASFMAFYGLGPGWGLVLMMASHQKFHSNCFRTVLISAFTDVIMSVFSCIVLFAILGVMANDIGVPVVEVVKSGISISLVGFSRALTYLPAPYIWAVMFFFGVIVVGFDGLLVCTETVVSFLEGIGYRLGRYSHIKLVLLVNTVTLLLNLPFCTQGGPYMFQLVDWYTPTWPIVVMALLGVIAFMWLYGGDRVDYGLIDMTGHKMPHMIRLAGAFITPVLLLFLLVSTFISYRPPKYGSYEYPGYTGVIGWILSCSVIAPIPLYMIWQLITLPGTLHERWMTLTRLSSDWGPSDSARRLRYLNTSMKEHSWTDVAYYNLTGRERTPANEIQEAVILF